MNGLAGIPTQPSAVEEKLLQKSANGGSFHMPKHHRSQSWTRPVYLPIPGVRTRHLRILVPNIPLSPFSRSASTPSYYSTPRLGGGGIIIGGAPFGSNNASRMMLGRRRRVPLVFALACLALVLTFMTIMRRGRSEGWVDESIGDLPTLIFRREDLQKIWQWEIESGHYPSHANIPVQVGLKKALVNPAIPKKTPTIKPTRYRPPSARDVVTDTHGAGPKRIYLDIQAGPPDVAYPPRPVPGSVADMDEIMRHCDFAQNKYVRDCLEVLRIGGGLDNGDRLRRANLDDWRYIYVEEPDNTTSPANIHDYYSSPRTAAIPAIGYSDDPNAGLLRKPDAEWEDGIYLPPTAEYRPSSTLEDPCDAENPRLFHMFWTGPFTDKPYLALLSFLFTQNTGIHLSKWPSDAKVCRPQFWLWINPGPAAAVPNPNAVRDMFDQLKSNPWASPFLHPRFRDVIKFKMWNTTEQLDGIPEIKDEWQVLQDSLFNSGGHIISVPKKPEPTSMSAVLEDDKKESGDDITRNSTQPTTSVNKSADDEDDLLNRTGSKSSSSYDRLSVILSDLARFVLCHRFGGVYLDADTIFLRDWEEIWGWKGAFAYRWSRLPKYNTAVLKMHKGSALGTFLFRTALKNGLDFHPMTVSKYTADAHLEGLLLRLPDALFDSAWLNTENYQRDRPPQPYFTEFAEFFDTPAQNGAAPQALGFRGFFRGAYSYHFHNFWWKPFDSSRNWPDLGPRFKAGEEQAKQTLAKEGKLPPLDPNNIESDKRDLGWATVLKRTFEAYIRGERPNMYGEWIQW